jgi:hypothetical protein
MRKKLGRLILLELTTTPYSLTKNKAIRLVNPKALLLTKSWLLQGYTETASKTH